jgi:hypothetical protein
MTEYERGVAAERERVAALMAMRAQPAYSAGALQELLSEAIVNGRSVSDTTGELVAALTRSTVLAEIESPGPIVTGQADTATGELPKQSPRREDVEEL